MQLLAAANQRQLRHSNTQTGHMDWETGSSLMTRLPNFQMNHGDSEIFNLTYVDATN